MNTCLYHLFLLSFLLSINCELMVSEVCSCPELQSQYDCEQNENCQWNTSCQTKEQIQTDPESVYCNDQQQEVCSNSIGCAYDNKKCIHFSGCTSYVYTTHNECQLVSTQCTSDGTQCIKPRECSKNQNEQLCSTVISSSGSKKCIWEKDECRDQTCDEAPISYITDLACNSFIKGCVTNGRGCLIQLKNCYNYNKDCDGMIGSDGLCESQNDKCQSKDCVNAPSTYYTDQQCQSFRKGCRTTGIGCTDKALKSCNTYTGDSEKCLKYIGSSGRCEEGQNGKCQARKCENASKQYSTDEQCKSYSSKCKTTGIGCVSILLNCNSYNGTKSECEKRIGADGKCTGSDTEVTSSCKVKMCSDGKFTTDNECGQYQYNCITNGVECTQFLLTCNKYKGEECNKYIGIDGKCTVGENGYCTINKCENANLKTNEECQSVQSYCLTNGTKCVMIDTCPNTIQLITCKANDKCQWTEQCVTNQCKYFLTKGICLGHSSNVECYWDDQTCVDKQCKHADDKYSTNKDCQQFLSNCVTNGQGCVDILAPCEEYVGDEDTCTYYKGNNGKIPCLYDSATKKCRSKTCQDNQSAKNQQDCDNTLEGCRFQGNSGCVNENAECQEYYGDSQQCYALNNKCSQNQNAIGKCRPLECYDNGTALEDYECNLFKSGCVTKGKGCISSTAPCSQYVGNSIDDCSKFVGNGKKCWYDQGFPSQCVDKQCSHNVDAQDDQECDKFLQGCVYNQKGCQDPQQKCDTYTGDEYQCSKYRGNELQCVKVDYCEDRKCSDLQNPLSLQECEEYLSNCAFDGVNCIDKKNCDQYSEYSKEQCQILVNLDGDLCTYGEINCTNRKCNDAINVSTQQDCTSYRKNCIFNGINKCEEIKKNCSEYSDFSEQGCQDVKNIEGKGCWFDKDGKCRDRTCSEELKEYSNEICQKHDSTCIYTGMRCTKQQINCIDYKTLSSSECRYIPNCWKQEDNDNTPCENRQCSDSVESPSDDNCRNHLQTCRFDGDNKCVNEQDKCSGYINFTKDACRQVTNKKGEKCWFEDSSTTCIERTCSNKLIQYSSEKCVDHLNICRFNGIECQEAKDTCSEYIRFSKEACSLVTTKNNQPCWHKNWSTICIDPTCNDNLQASTINCQKHLNTCRFNGSRCIEAKEKCQYYIGSNQVCSELTDLNSNQCWYDINNTQGKENNCIQKECSNKQDKYNLEICQQYIGKIVDNKYNPSCTYDGIKCINIQTNCSQYIGYNIQQCLIVTTLSGESCFQDNNNSNNICRTRKCSDNQTAINDLQCDQFLKGCKTTGKGCTESTQQCNRYTGTQSSCLKFIGNGKKCRGSNTSGKCSDSQCFHDQESITDIQCNSFMEGCVTNGKGCVSSLEPCSSYIGNREICSKFKGNQRLCYSDSLDNLQICRDKQCSDNSIAITDSDCNTFMPGCVTKGKGCIDDTEPCSNYYGTQFQCSKFKGEKGTKRCWNISEATSNTRCLNRECNHMPRGTNDIECNSFLEGCISDGFQCLTKRNCSQFYGTIKTCILFNAFDKPCKGIDDTIQQCKQLQCIDAPNNYDTDDKCNQFKSGCKTTGYGCIDFNTCEMLSSKQLCKERIDCQYIDGCINTIKVCMQITKYSQCLNNSNIKCSWDFKTKSCRDWNCTDASILLETNDQCQALNSNCTTTGKGCININHCNQYKNKLTCSNALSLGYSKKCVWEINICRDKVCEDAPIEYQEDQLCKEISPECVTSGQGCIYKQYSCENIKLKTKCIQDSQKNPCLWMNLTQTCITFSQCSDIIKTTPQDCELYSKMCTSNGQHCISHSKCSEYTNPTSCYKGTDGDCGWVIEQINSEPTCQKFQQCSDILGRTKEHCQYYSKNCTSDGQKCIEIRNCESYLTKFGCNTSGKDDQCFWEESQEKPICRLQICTDIPLITNMTYQYCSSFNTQLQCTTNQSQCINKKKCSEYLEESCYEGTDGACIFALPLNQSSGTKQCRTKECLDYIEYTTEACNKLKPGCISNGIRCQQRLNCSDYTTEIACESDGKDGVCIFDEKKKCSLLTKCEQANNNQIACSKKSKVCHLEYKKINDTTTIIECSQIKCINSPNCSPLLNFIGTQFSACIQKSKNECIDGFPYQLSQSRCYSKSFQTYFWNTSTLECQKCKQTENNTNQTHPIYQNTLKSIILILIIIII